MSGEGETVRVLIADGHPVYLDGLVAAIEGAAGLELVAACTDVPAALERIRSLTPDVAVIDDVLPGMGATEILDALAGPTCVVVVAARVDGEAIYRAIQAGARGYVLKSSSRVRICEAVRTVARGGTTEPSPASARGTSAGAPRTRGRW